MTLGEGTFSNLDVWWVLRDFIIVVDYFGLGGRSDLS